LIFFFFVCLSLLIFRGIEYLTECPN